MPSSCEAQPSFFLTIPLGILIYRVGVYGETGTSKAQNRNSCRLRLWVRRHGSNRGPESYCRGPRH
jgi:hypothetical protein